MPLWPREVGSLCSVSFHHDCFFYNLRNHQASFGLRSSAHAAQCLDSLPPRSYFVPSLCSGPHGVCRRLLLLRLNLLTWRLCALSSHGFWASQTYSSLVLLQVCLLHLAVLCSQTAVAAVFCVSGPRTCLWIGPCLEGWKNPTMLSSFYPCVNLGGSG